LVVQQAREWEALSCNAGTRGLPCAAVKTDSKPCETLDGACVEPGVCPLTRVAAGTEVCIKQLAASPELRARLRELGMGEQRRIKLLSRQSNLICQVCNARFGLSEEVAESIWVEPVPRDTAPD